MKNKQKIITYECEGSLGRICMEFIDEKRALGYIYNAEAKKLREFCKFTTTFIFPENTLSEDLVKAWIKRKPYDSDRTQYARLALVKLLAQYMNRMSYTAFCPQKEMLGKINWSYTPYIFTHAQIKDFFIALDSLKKKEKSFALRRHLIMPILFRLLYCCGLRVSEVLNLLVEDFIDTEGILTIRDTKFKKNRYIPLSNELSEVCRKYIQKHTIGPGTYLFRAPDDGPYNTRSIYNVFRDILWDAGISHGGRGKGPRLHDFRHTFAVHSLEKMIKEGKELTSSLPRLSTYLGHSDLTATEKYLRLTAELYPEITNVLDKQYGFIFSGKGGLK